MVVTILGQVCASVWNSHNLVLLWEIWPTALECQLWQWWPSHHALVARRSATSPESTLCGWWCVGLRQGEGPHYCLWRLEIWWLCNVKMCWRLTPATISESMERRGKSVRIAKLRAEYVAWRLVNEISFWRWDFHMMGHPLRAIMYPVWDFADLGEWSGSQPWRPAKSAST